MFSFIDPGPFPHMSLGPGLSNNFCDQHNVEQPQAVGRGKKKKIHAFFSFIWDTESSTKN